MNYRNIIYMSVLFIVLPVWIGYIWIELLKIKEGWSRFVHAWVMGFVTMLAVAQVILVPCVALQTTLSFAMSLWQIALSALATISFFLLLLRWKRGEMWWQKKCDISQGVAEKTDIVNAAEAREKRLWTIAFGVIAAVLIFMQAYIPARYEHRDDDDARFVAEEVSAVVHDTMYIDDPIEGSYMYWEQGEVKKDLTSPWAMYVAMSCRLSNIAPAVMSHTYLPFFLILICYAVYLLIGWTLTKGDWEKTFLFLIFLSVIHLWGYTSTHTLASMLLLRIWQGKAVCASLILPLFFYVMYQVMHEKYEKGWIGFLFVMSTGACLLSGIGIVTAPVMLFIYGIVDFFYYRKWKKTALIWMATIPCAVCLLYYLLG